MKNARFAVAAKLVAACLALAVLAIPSLAAAQADEVYYEDTDPAALSDFREPLAPHGAWVDDGVYGTVWIPDVVVVGRDFRPYHSAGRWAVSDEGDWVFVSDYDWGYIPFHYGRWIWISERAAWAWVPGRRYAPAWVVWRVGEPGYDYVGWAPMGPTYYWVDGSAMLFFGAVTLPFWFVHSHYLFHPHWRHHVAHHDQLHEVAQHTHVHHGHYDHQQSGPDHKPAQGHVSSTGTPHSGAKAHTASAYRPSSPSFAAARVPASSQPKDRIQKNERAMKLAPAPQGYESRRADLQAKSRSQRATVRSSRAARSNRAPAARNEVAVPSERTSTVVPHRRDNGLPARSYTAPSRTFRSRPAPAVNPSRAPSHATQPSRAPSRNPAIAPSRTPSRSPSVAPSRSPSRSPSVSPSRSSSSRGSARTPSRSSSPSKATPSRQSSPSRSRSSSGGRKR